MNRLKKIIQQAPTTASVNLQRSGDTTAKEEKFPFLDGRSLRRAAVARTKQFNLRLRSEILQRLYQRAAREQRSLTMIVEAALTAYLQE